MSLHRATPTTILHTAQSNQIMTPQKFTQKNVELSHLPLFFPEGFEKIFVAIYVVFLPYIAGLLFILLYIAKGNLDLFISLYEKQVFILTWAMGYEIMAALMLLWIVKMSLGFAYENSKQSVVKPFRRP